MERERESSKGCTHGMWKRGSSVNPAPNTAFLSSEWGKPSSSVYVMLPPHFKIKYFLCFKGRHREITVWVVKVICTSLVYPQRSEA